MSLIFKNLNLKQKSFFEKFLDELDPKIPAIGIVYISEILGVSLPIVLGYLKIPDKNLIRKIKRGDLLSREDAKLLLGIVGIVKQVDMILNSPVRLRSFNAGRWLGDWMQEAVPALGDVPPGTYLFNSGRTGNR